MRKHSCLGSDAAPLLLHFDGAEVYREQEFGIWSLSSFVNHGAHIHDHQMLCMLVPGDVAEAVGKETLHACVARMLAWSQEALFSNCWPERDVDGNVYEDDSVLGKRAGAWVQV